MSSWYNHWTSILIENVFKSHKRVIPAIGLIKKIDFFIDNIPFDLKVTYFPSEYMQNKRKEQGLKTELMELKTIAKQNSIHFNNNNKDKEIFFELYSKLSESHITQVKKSMDQFQKTRTEIIKNALSRKNDLIRWLYEKQGERRFDAANRLFLILVDTQNIDQSWKLKRNIDFLKRHIVSYLNQFKKSDYLKVQFTWKDRRYQVISDILFVIRD